MERATEHAIEEVVHRVVDDDLLHERYRWVLYELMEWLFSTIGTFFTLLVLCMPADDVSIGMVLASGRISNSTQTMPWTATIYTVYSADPSTAFWLETILDSQHLSLRRFFIAALAVSLMFGTMVSVTHHAALRHDPARKYHLVPPMRIICHFILFIFSISTGISAIILSNYACSATIPDDYTGFECTRGPAIFVTFYASLHFIIACVINFAQLISHVRGTSHEATALPVKKLHHPLVHLRFWKVPESPKIPNRIQATLDKAHGNRKRSISKDPESSFQVREKKIEPEIDGSILLNKVSGSLYSLDDVLAKDRIQTLPYQSQTIVKPQQSVHFQETVPLSNHHSQAPKSEFSIPTSDLSKGVPSTFTAANLYTSPQSTLILPATTKVSQSRSFRRPRQATLGLEESLQSPAVALVPLALRQGMMLLKLSTKRARPCSVRLVPEEGRVLWNSKERGVIDMENVRELRFGELALGKRNRMGLSAADEDRAIMIVYGGQARRVQSLHLIATDDEAFQLWKDALEALHSSRRALLGGLDQLKRRETAWLRQIWASADVNADDSISLSEAIVLCRRLGLSSSPQEIETLFQASDSQGLENLDKSDFRTFVQHLKRRPDIESILQTLTNNRPICTQQEFIKFMRGVQRSVASDAELIVLYGKFANPQNRSMDIEGFTSFLASADNPTYSHQNGNINMDMNRPLTDYYISCSHNTYLVATQYKGESTIEGYVRTLQDGCRSVEEPRKVDLWDGPFGLPIVYHGHTFTSQITSHDVFSTIARYAFVTSPYPLILSLETHLSPNQQIRLVETLKSTLGDAMLTEPLPGTSDRFPSPEELKYKILIKTKNRDRTKGLYTADVRPVSLKSEEVPMVSDVSSDSESDQSLFEDDSSLHDDEPPILHRAATAPTIVVSSPPSAAFNYSPSAAFNSETHTSAIDDSAELRNLTRSTSSTRLHTDTLAVPTTKSRLRRVRHRTKSSKGEDTMTSDLKALLVYTSGVSFEGFNKSYGFFETISMKERLAVWACRRRVSALRGLTGVRLVRAYPAAKRILSSNFNPHDLWAAGVQLVALNLQTYDLSHQMHTCFFSRNGGTGYVLKPQCILDGYVPRPEIKYKFNIQILSAQRLASVASNHLSNANHFSNEENPNLKPSVTVSIYPPGTSLLTCPWTKTSQVSGNAFNPTFNHSAEISFKCSPDLLELCFVEFAVLNSHNHNSENSIGKFCVAMASLLPGYRHLPLYDRFGTQLLFSSLFINSSLQQA